MNAHLRSLIFQAIDQTISDEDFERLQTELEQNAEFRDEYLRAVRLSETLSEFDVSNLPEPIELAKSPTAQPMPDASEPAM